jgi:hypothetical protein
VDDEQPATRPWWLLPVGRVRPIWWALIGVAVLAIDYAAGPDSQFPVLYVIPVILAAWYSGRKPAAWLAITVPLFHLVVVLFTLPPGQNTTLLAVMTVARGVVVLIMALWFARLSEHERQLLRYVVKLEGLLPICSMCKSIRNEKGVWEPLEAFISQRSDADFTHGLCPHCLRRHY